MNYLLDTCVISDFFKKRPSVVKRFEAVSPEKLNISTITVMEIEYGLKLNSERETKIRPLWKALLDHIHVIHYSPKCAAASALVRASLKSSGQSIGPYDVLIAGTSLAHNLIMITSNMKEFTRISDLIIEDWRN